MTSAVLDKPADLALEDFSIACAIHEIVQGRECDRPATLTIRVHTCQATVSCQLCWNTLVKHMKDREKGRKGDDFLLGGGWHCSVCKKTAKRFEDLMWSEPL